MKLLRLTPALKATSSSYNQFSLGFKDEYDQTIISFKKHEIPINEKISVYHAGGSLISLYNLLKNLISVNQYDVIHIHNGVTGVVFLLSIFPWRLRLLNRTVFTLHNSWSVLKKRNRFLNIFMMLFSAKVCTCGKASYRSLPKILHYFIRKKTQAVVNGFNDKRIDSVARNKVQFSHFQKDSAIKILYVGALNGVKNQIALLKVLKLIKIEAEVIFLGDGPRKNKLIDFSQSLPLSTKVCFKGLVSRDLAIEHMLEADIFVSLSNGEGLPIAVLEAMYAGCFMLLSKIPPHQEVSPPAQRCSFVNPSDLAEVSRVLTSIKDNLERIKGERSISKQYSLDTFGLKNMINGYREVYESIIDAEKLFDDELIK